MSIDYSRIWDEGETLVSVAQRLRVGPIVLGEWDPFHSKATLTQMFKDLCNTYPNLASYEIIGNDSGGNPVWLFKIGNPNGGRVCWDGALHGNEDFGSEIIYQLLLWLLESGDAQAQRILNGNYILFVPIALNRWDRSNYNTSQCSYGVNLNRNFRTGWRLIACDSTEAYSGPAAISEAETQVLRNLWNIWHPIFYVNLHQGAEPYVSYYSGAQSILAQQAITKMQEIAQEMGVTPWSYRSSGSTGFAIGDAAADYGAAAFMIEVYPSWSHTSTTWNKLINEMTPKAKVLFIAQCQLCEKVGPTQYTLTISSTPGGTTSPAPGIYSYNEGDIVKVTAQPSVSPFINWLLDGIIRTENPINIVMNINHILHCVFKKEMPETLFYGGLNYLSRYWNQIPSENMLRRDFALFKKNNIYGISMPLLWRALETDRGTYLDNRLEDFKQVCLIANEYGLKVAVDFHTFFQEVHTGWGVPNYCIDPYSGRQHTIAIIRDADIQSAWLDFVSHVVTYLHNVPNIDSWALLNEPMYWGTVPVNQKEAFILLIQSMAQIVRSIDSRPLCCRFVSVSVGGNDYLQSQFGYDPRIFSTLDFTGFTFYLPSNPAQFSIWMNLFNMMIQNCKDYGHSEIRVFEFGQNTIDNTLQANTYRDYMNAFKVAGVKAVYAWHWRPDYTVAEGDEGFNLCADTLGTPRPAFYEMSSVILPPPPEFNVGLWLISLMLSSGVIATVT